MVCLTPIFVNGINLPFWLGGSLLCTDQLIQRKQNAYVIGLGSSSDKRDPQDNRGWNADSTSNLLQKVGRVAPNHLS